MPLALHVTPPAAVAPDGIPPGIGAGDVQAGYDQYGVRVPAVVVSPWSRPGYVSNVVHDHTSILGFIERKWNIAPMTLRDANADALLDFFDFSAPAFATPPTLAAPGNPAASQLTCSTADPGRPVEPYPGGQRPGGNPTVLPPTPPANVPDLAPAAVVAAGAAVTAVGVLRRDQPGSPRPDSRRRDDSPIAE